MTAHRRRARKPIGRMPGKAPSLDGALAGALLGKVRAACLAFPGTSERSSHGSPSFFVASRRAFVHFCDNHHHDGRIALWCAAPEGAQAMLVDSDPDIYFVPPYVGGLSWVSVRLDRKAPWPEIAAVIENAYRTRAGVGRSGKAPRP